MNESQLTAFAGSDIIAAGNFADVARAAKAHFENNKTATILIFDNVTGEQIDLDFSLSSDSVGVKTNENSLANSAKVGRPKLGVVSREVTLLPRHWQWLNMQPGGASVAIRKLVEKARKDTSAIDEIRQAQESCYRFISAMAGNFVGFEEASRALFAGNEQRFKSCVATWPEDIVKYASKLSDKVWKSLT